MYYVGNCEVIPAEWCHDSTIQNTAGRTVAMLLADNGKDIPKQCEHDPNVRDKRGMTVAESL